MSFFFSLQGGGGGGGGACQRGKKERKKDPFLEIEMCRPTFLKNVYNPKLTIRGVAFVFLTCSAVRQKTKKRTNAYGSQLKYTRA